MIFSLGVNYIAIQIVEWLWVIKEENGEINSCSVSSLSYSYWQTTCFICVLLDRKKIYPFVEEGGLRW